MTTSLSEPDAIASSLLALMHGPGSPYRQRLRNLLAERLRSANTGASAHLVLAAPGLELAGLLSELLAELDFSFAFHDYRLPKVNWPVANSEDILFLVLPEQLDSGVDKILAAELGQSPAKPSLILSCVPPAGLRKPGSYGAVIDFRDICYDRTDLDYLLTQYAGLVAPASRSLTGYDLLRYTQGWPLLTEAVLVQLLDCHSGKASAADPAGYSVPGIARLPTVQAVFEQAWRPVLLRFVWLPGLAVLPMLNLDLLLHLFPDAGREVANCLAMGFLQSCNQRAGFYQLNPFLEGLLLVERDDKDNEQILQRAAKWYQGHGYLSEAIECLVALGASEEILAAMQDRLGDETQSAATVTVVGLGQSSRVAIAAVTRSGPAKPPFLESSAARDREAAGDLAAQSASQQVDPAMSPAVSHFLSAYRSHCDANAQGVGSAVAAAVESGINRQQLSSLVDFVDVHIRPLLRDSDTPLRYALKDVRHSAPAREAVAAQYQALNHRESQILQRICEGYKNREISEQLGLELSTIKWYSTRIYEKLKVKNRTQAVARAQVLGLFG